MIAPEQKRLEELALRAAYTGGPAFTRFLEPSMLDAARGAANRAGAHAAFYGGFEEAERRMAAFYADEPPAPEDYPLAVLRIDWNDRFNHPGHRDLLGAAMGLGLERETLGDIAPGARDGAPCAYLFCLADVAGYICANLASAGRATVKVSVETGAPNILPPEGERLRLTVQNERLDAVLAAACRLSRAEAQRLIAAGLVKLNHVPNLRADARLREGDLISARGLGRVRVEEFLGESRRGRRVVSAFRYRG